MNFKRTYIIHNAYKLESLKNKQRMKVRIVEFKY